MRPSMLDPEEAFRAGLQGSDWESVGIRGLAEASHAFAFGPNEELVLATRRLPGLRDPRGAFETGRALRFIARLFDRAGAPASVGRQFRDNLAAAILTHHMRRRPAPWTALDTVQMFMELYGRVLGFEGSDYERVRAAILHHAQGRDAAPAVRRQPSGGSPLFRSQRRRAASF